jgi:hypothetical protein
MRSVSIRFSVSTVHAVVISPYLLHVTSSLLFLNLHNKWRIYRLWSHLYCGCTYLRLTVAWNASLYYLVGGAKHTAHLFILTALSPILFQFHILGRITVRDFWNLKWFVPLASRPQEIFTRMFPGRNVLYSYDSKRQQWCSRSLKSGNCNIQFCYYKYEIL